MKDHSETPFDSVEGAHEYLGLLAEPIGDAKNKIEADINKISDPQFPRRLEALRLVLFKLDKLDQNIRNGSRLLNDLRTLRRLLLDERVDEPAPKKKH